MTIKITLTNPAEHGADELRAFANFLNNLAATKGSAGFELSKELTEYRAPVYDFSQGARVAETEVPRLQVGPTGEIPAAPLAPSTTAAPGASDGSAETTAEAADADGEPNTGDTDSNGVTWDARIHSETRSTNKDGSWRQKRGVDPELVKQVLAEQQGAEVPPAPPAAPVVEVPPAPPAPVAEAPAAPAAVAPADVVRFVTLNKIPTDQAIPVYQSFGLANAAALFTQPDLAPAVLEALKGLVA